MNDCLRCKDGLYNIDVRAGKCLSCGRVLTLTIREEMESKEFYQFEIKLSIWQRIKSLWAPIIIEVTFDESKPTLKEVVEAAAAHVKKDQLDNSREQLEQQTEEALNGPLGPIDPKGGAQAPIAAAQVQAENVPPYTGNALPDREWKPTRILCVFPGLGKTYYHEHSDEETLDSDSSNFSWISTERTDKARNPEFPDNYLEHIRQNIGKVDTILVSSHKDVRDALDSALIPFTLVYPENSTESKEAMLERYKERGSSDEYIKQLGDNWDKFMESMKQQEGCTHAVLPKGMYLSEYLENVDKAEA